MLKLDTITDLQFLVIEVIRARKIPGREIREKLRAHGVRIDGPAFYQMMARLERGGLVEGWYEQKAINGRKVRERRYRVLGYGERAYLEKLEFYSRRAIQRANGGLQTGEP